MFLDLFQDFVVAVLGSFESVCSGVSLFGSKGLLCLLCFVAGAVGSWICPCWRSFHFPFLTVANYHSSSFFATLVSSSCADLLGSICGGCGLFLSLLLPVKVVFRPLLL